MNLKIKTFADLMQHGECTIACLYTGTVVRTLTVEGDNCHLVAGDGTVLDIPLETKITYGMWCLDRGDMLFTLNGREMKVCGEGDILTTKDGTKYTVTPGE